MKRRTVGTLIAAGVVLVLVSAGTAEAQPQEPECEIRFARSPALYAPVHLKPGESRTIELDVRVITKLMPEALSNYEWSVGSSQLGSASPDRGVPRFRAWVDRENEELVGYVGPVQFTFTAGGESGAEALPVSVHAQGQFPPGCEEGVLPVPISVGGEWSFHSEYWTGQAIRLDQFQVGSFSVGQDGRIQGEGTTYVHARGTCVVSNHVAPVRIGGRLEDGQLRLSLTYPETADPDTRILSDSPGCAFRGAVESLALVADFMASLVVLRDCIDLSFPADRPRTSYPADLPEGAAAVRRGRCGNVSVTVERLN